jgi:phage-related protein
VSWSVETLNSKVDEEIAALPPRLGSRMLRLMESIGRIGLERLGEPHVKHIEGKLWELRAKAPEGIARAFYVTAVGRRVVVLYVFVKKSQKTPGKALAIARERMRQVLP